MFRNILKYLLILSSLTAAAQQGQLTAQAQWWRESVFYQIYMPSFQDSDGNGYSDFVGMTTRLDYLQSLGIKGIWLTPFLKSPKVDNGYDVADYYQIDTVYGNMDDFCTFLNETHRRGIKVIMDMVVNHTSTDCRWFKESRKSLDNPYRDFYIWRDKPNNWESFFGGGAWELDALTNQYYYHKFDTRMADLNWSNPMVVEEIQKVLRFWLDIGIDGFRLDVIDFLTTDGITVDNPVKDGRQEHKFDIGQLGVGKAMRIIKSTISEYENRFVVGEIGSDKLEVLIQYQAPALMDVVFNFNFGSIPEFSAECIFNELQSMEECMSDYPTLFFGSHDMPRLMDRLAGGKPEKAKALAALMLTAKGVPFIYCGEEIGMQNIEATSFNEIVDIQGKTQYHLALRAGKTPEEALTEGNKHNRDKSRSPMQWDESTNAGFSSCKPWIKIHENFGNVNVQWYLQPKSSILNTYKTLIAIRNSEKALQYGNYDRLEHHDGRILFTRSYAEERITVIVNFGEEINIELPLQAELILGKAELKTNEFLIYKH
ncbi:MAG: alpha-amylase family glycosyl hydrolase [Bacteroidales bacterium]|nr:alpha-amylase family glycosyl hydrolase [Bacteroidales bacterium]MDZ4205336.1 alpha-amylase family glycosyl hydrolase [Bacteroidales bacterium]